MSICGKHMSVGHCQACEVEAKSQNPIRPIIPTLWPRALEHLAEALAHLKVAHSFSQTSCMEIDGVSAYQTLDRDGDCSTLANRVEQTIAKFSLRINDPGRQT